MKIISTDSYRSPDRKPPWFAGTFPNLVFYGKLIPILLKGCRLAKKGGYGSSQWVISSMGVFRALESVGVKVQIENMSVFQDLESPCIFVGNHMSTMETFVLPYVIQPHRDVTFVVKQTLLEIPFFKHVMISRNPVVVGRKNPRDDLKSVLVNGQRLLAGHTSLIIFPQTTRSLRFNPGEFNSLAVKLAKRVGVPLIPFALKTDAWGMGRFAKDFGRIDSKKTVYFHFGEPISVTGSGREEHDSVVRFITGKLEEWS